MKNGIVGVFPQEKGKAWSLRAFSILYNMEDKRNGKSRIDPIIMLPVDNGGICKANASSDFMLISIY